MSNVLFDIQNLSCSYSQREADKVLFIDSLQIPKGKIIFLLGASGSGKSTFLETLGLMNSTIAGGEVTFFPNGNAKPVHFSKLWQKDAQEAIAEIRKRYFSFIFQQTNLMENFTAYENICISRMIQNNISQQEAVMGAQQLMTKVKLPESEVNIKTLAVNLSGGQKQRIAFVRALLANYTVLFGDEPTGNLDEGNAHDLIEIIKKQLQNSQTAIIVSHNIDLAIQNADQIIVITKEQREGFGTIKRENIFYKEDWENYTPQQLIEFRAKLSAYYSLNSAAGIKKIVSGNNGSLNNNYRTLFLLKESRALMGKKFINLAILVIMLFFTLLMVGFANGSLAYLEQKMKDPFVNWLTIDIPWGKSTEINNLKNLLNAEEEKAKFGYENVSSYVDYPLFFWDQERKDFLRAKGRSIEMQGEQNQFLKDVLSDDNWIAGSREGFQGEQDLGLIVTERLLADFHYPKDAAYMIMRFSANDTIFKVPVPIKSVVRDIPGKNLFVFTSCFFRTIINDFENTFDIQKKNTINFLLKSDRATADKLVNFIHEFARTQNSYKGYNPDGSISDHRNSYAKGFDIELTFQPRMSFPIMNQLYDDLIHSSSIAPYAPLIERTYRYDPANNCSIDQHADMLSVQFNSLNLVRSFADTLFYKYNTANQQEVIEVDIAKVREKENFNFLSGITKIIAYLLVVFAAIGISLFVSNLLQMHLTKQKMNLGTLKAFGLGNTQSQSIYFTIVVGFVIISFAIAFVSAWGFGFVLDSVLSRSLNVEQGVSYFKIIHPTTLITLLILTITTLAVAILTIRKILSKSPGDLIFGR